MAARYCLLRMTTVPMPTRRCVVHGRQRAAGRPARGRRRRAPASRCARSRSGRSSSSVDEVGDLDRARRLGAQRRRARSRRTSTYLPLRDLVAHHDVVGLDRLAGLLRDLLVAGSGRPCPARAGGSAPSWSRTAVYAFTGTLTSPKLMEPLQTGRVIGPAPEAPAPGPPEVGAGRRPRRAVEHGADRPAVGAQVRVVELVPRDRHRHRRAGRGSGAERRDERLVDGVLGVVEPGPAARGRACATSSSPARAPVSPIGREMRSTHARVSSNV